jgi:hypothetical protein
MVNVAARVRVVSRRRMGIPSSMMAAQGGKWNSKQ